MHERKGALVNHNSVSMVKVYYCQCVTVVALQFRAEVGDAGSVDSQKGFPVVGGLYATEAVQLLQQFYITGNPRGKPVEKATIETLSG